MKKRWGWIAALLMLALLLGLGIPLLRAPTGLGESELYSEWDRRLAAAAIRLDFLLMPGFRLEEIRYAGDEKSSDEYDYYSRHQKEMGAFDACIVFQVDFHSPRRAADALETDADYRNWGYILVRKSGGLWRVLTQGYG